MSTVETLFPTSASVAGKTNTELALEVGQAWLDGTVSMTPVGRHTQVAEGDLVLQGESLWVAVDSWANSHPESDWDKREGVYRPVEVWLQVLGGTETEHLSWVLKFDADDNHTYRVNLTAKGASRG